MGRRRPTCRDTKIGPRASPNRITQNHGPIYFYTRMWHVPFMHARSQRGNNLPHIRDRACGISSAPRPPHTVSHLPEGGRLCLSLRSVGPAATKTHAATRDATVTHYTFHVDYHSSQCPMEPSPPVNASMCGSSRLSCMRAAATPSRLPLPSAIGAALATK